jgi:hypothetical protein
VSDGDPTSPRIRTPDEAHALVPELVRLADEVVVVRAELTEATRSTPPAPLAEAKGLEARLSELLDRIMALDVQLKGWAPLLVDIPVRVDGREVLFCWLEGDRTLAWYHEVPHGFAGRRPLSDLPSLG